MNVDWGAVEAIVVGFLTFAGTAGGAYVRHRSVMKSRDVDTARLEGQLEIERERAVSARQTEVYDLLRDELKAVRSELDSLRDAHHADKLATATQVAGLTVELGYAKARIAELEARERTLKTQVEELRVQRDEALEALAAA
jgi:chromosome segregation ATPase